MRTIDVYILERNPAGVYKTVFPQSITSRNDNTDSLANEMLAAADRYQKLHGKKLVLRKLRKNKSRDIYTNIIT